MSCVIFRAEKRKRGGALAMARHALRDGVTVPNAIPNAPPPTVLMGATRARQVTERLQELEAAAIAAGQRLRENNTRAVDMLITYSPGAIQSLDDQNRFFSTALRWIRERWPTAEILTAALHRDETTPHLQILLAPLDAAGRFNAKLLMGGPEDFRRHQDSIYEACGAPFGLQRGQRGSDARHVTPTQLYGAMADGAEAPVFVPVPPAPTMLDRLKPGVYRMKKTLRDEALKANQNTRKLIERQAATGRKLHPRMVERQADRYRSAIHAAMAARADLAAAAAERTAAEAILSQAKLHQQQATALAAAASKLDAKSQAQLLDKFSRHMAPEYVGLLSQRLGIDLVPGRGLCDQIRRAGLAGSLIQAATVIDQAGEGDVMPAARRWQDSQKPDTPKA